MFHQMLGPAIKGLPHFAAKAALGHRGWCASDGLPVQPGRAGGRDLTVDVDVRSDGQRYAPNPAGIVKAAQARGDFQVLAERDRRLLRVHLGADVQAGLATLRSAMEQALA